VRRLPEQLAIIAVALISVPLPSYALPTPPPPPVRFGTVDWQWGSPEQGVGGADDYLSGSVVRVKGHDENKPVAATKIAPHIEFADPLPVEIPIYSVAGKKWVLGSSQLVPGGFGPLAAVTGGLEPTGRKVFNTGQDNEAEFKLVLVRIDQPAGIAYFEPFVRACIRKPFSKNWLTCTGYVIPTGIEIPVPETTKFPIDINFDYFHFKVPDVAKMKVKDILSAGNLKKFGISTGASIAGSALSGGLGGGPGGSSGAGGDDSRPNRSPLQPQGDSSGGGSSNGGGYSGSFSGRTMNPVDDPRTSGFGPRARPCPACSKDHKGLDFGAAEGTPVKAAATGRIIYQGWIKGYGKTIFVDHGGGYITQYSHLSDYVGRPGSDVQMGAVIGISGHTGVGTGSHLHFGVIAGASPGDYSTGYYIDPRKFLGY
jgi:murein DD-endopeptidase MepM/ murein hydrolase activator NlpD